MPLIHIHEDDWGLRSLHPTTIRTEVGEDLAASIAASERNRDPSGFGWTDIHVVAPPSADFRDLVDVASLRAALAPLMPAVTRFHATAGSRSEGARDPLGSYDEAATCFGFDASCYVKADLVDGSVTAIWFDCWTADAARRDALVLGLRAVDALTPCHLVDYRLQLDGDVGDAAFLARYGDLLLASRRGAT